VHGVGSQVRAVRPAHRAELVDRYLTEHCLVAQWLKHFAVELAGQVYRARNPVIELDVQLVFWKRGDPYDMGHHLLTPMG
jgi:hypothetical protein